MEFTVLSTNPVDGNMSATATAITINLSAAPNPSTVSTQAADGACSGAVQISFDDFQTCLGGTVSTSGSAVTFQTTWGLPFGVSIKVKAASSIMNTSGVALSAYQSTSGFMQPQPCSNCFISYSAPAVVGGTPPGRTFKIQSNAMGHLGKFISIHGGSTSTTMFNPTTQQTSLGPTLTTSPGVGGHTIYISSGTNIGKHLVVIGGSTITSNLYDPTLHTFAGGPSLGVGQTVGNGGFSFELQSGASMGDILTFRANSSTTGLFYSAAGGTYSAPGTFDASVPVAQGGHAIRLPGGTEVGNWAVFPAGATTTVNTLTESSVTMNLGALPAAPCASGVGNAAASVAFTLGAQAGKILLVCNGGSTDTYLLSMSPYAWSGAMNLPSSPGSGFKILEIKSGPYAGYAFAVSGNSNPDTYLFNPNTLSWSFGPNLHGSAGQGSSILEYDFGNGQRFWISHGNTSVSSSTFDTTTGKMVGSRIPRNAATGTSMQYIASGTHSGKYLFVSANTHAELGAFDPKTLEFDDMPSLANNAGAGGVSFVVPSGIHKDKIIMILGGGGTNCNMYSPAANTVTTCPFTPTAFNGFAVWFSPVGGIYDGQIIFSKQPATAADKWDPAAPATYGSAFAAFGCTLGAGHAAIPITLGAYAGGALILCGGGTTTTKVFNPASGTFVAGPPLFSGAGAGSTYFLLTAGANAGKYLIVHANGLGSTSIWDQNDIVSTMVNGPSLTAPCGGTLNSGSTGIVLQSGANAGKFLLTRGNGALSACLLAANGSSAVAAPSVGPHVGYNTGVGAVFRQLNSGKYPKGIFFAHGDNANVFSVYLP